MAKTLALINKDIAAHLAQKKIFTPPEAVELTRIYNQMGDLLNKPTNKIKNIGVELDIYHRMLRRFMKLMEKFQFGETPIPEQDDNPVIPTPPVEKPPIQETSGQTTIVQDADIESNMGLDDIFDRDSDSDHQFITPTSPTRGTSSPIHDLASSMSQVQLVSPSQQTADKILSILKQAQLATIYSSSGQNVGFTINGKVYPISTLSQIVKKLQPQNKKPLTPDEKVLAQVIAETGSTAGTETFQAIQKHLPSISDYFATSLPSQSTRTLGATRRRVADPDATVVSSKPSIELKPSKLGNIKGSGTVHFKRWQHHIDQYKKLKVRSTISSPIPW